MNIFVENSHEKENKLLFVYAMKQYCVEEIIVEIHPDNYFLNA